MWSVWSGLENKHLVRSENYLATVAINLVYVVFMWRCWADRRWVWCFFRRKLVCWISESSNQLTTQTTICFWQLKNAKNIYKHENFWRLTRQGSQELHKNKDEQRYGTLHGRAQFSLFYFCLLTCGHSVISHLTGFKWLNIWTYVIGWYSTELLLGYIFTCIISIYIIIVLRYSVKCWFNLSAPVSEIMCTSVGGTLFFRSLDIWWSV